MTEPAAIHNLDPVKTGDIWEQYPGVSPLICTGIDDDGSPMPRALAEVNIQFRHKSSKMVGLTLSSGHGITITDASAWAFQIDRQVMTLSPGTWVYDIELVDTNGEKRSYIEGELPVRADQSHA